MNKKGFYKNCFVHICYCLPDFCVQRAWTNPDDPGQTVGLFSLLVLKKKKEEVSSPLIFTFLSVLQQFYAIIIIKNMADSIGIT